MSGSSNLNSFRDSGQVAVQLVSCGVLLPGLVQDCTQHSCVIAIQFLVSNTTVNIYIKMDLVLMTNNGQCAIKPNQYIYMCSPSTHDIKVPNDSVGDANY